MADNWSYYDRYDHWRRGKTAEGMAEECGIDKVQPKSHKKAKLTASASFMTFFSGRCRMLSDVIGRLVDSCNRADLSVSKRSGAL